MTALQVACEKKDEEIHQLDQSLSQMSIDKEEMYQISTKLVQTEEDLAQANREVQVCKKNACVCVCTYVCVHIYLE